MGIVLKELSYQVTGICFLVHNELGRYRNEHQYCDALARAFDDVDLRYQREFVVPTSFDGERVGRNRVDFLLGEQLVLEVKAKALITRDDYYQVRRYLAALRFPLGLIVNFQQPYLHPKRVLNSAVR